MEETTAEDVLEMLDFRGPPVAESEAYDLAASVRRAGVARYRRRRKAVVVGLSKKVVPL